MSKDPLDEMVDSLLSQEGDDADDTASAPDEDVLSVAAEDFVKAVHSRDPKAVAQVFRSMLHLADGAASIEPADDDEDDEVGYSRGGTVYGVSVHVPKPRVPTARFRR